MHARLGRGSSSLLAAALLLAACSSGGSAQHMATAPAPTPYRAPSPAAHAYGPAGASGANDASLASAMSTARSTGHPVCLMFLATWCGYCKKLEAQTLPDPSVQAELRNFTVVRMDPDQGAGRQLADRYGVHGFPTVVVLDANGNAKKTLVGFEPPASFTAGLRSAR